jgi:hypothetical protein
MPTLEEKFKINSIPEMDFPLIVFSDHTSGLIAALIKTRTDATYNHVMWAVEPGMFASQGNTYSKVPFKRYMQRTSRLKFVKVIGLTAIQKRIILTSINRKLALPWYKKLYDWFGIFGQAVGIKSINVNGLNYCSEDVALHLTSIVDYVADVAFYEALSLVPLHGSPEDLNAYFKKYPKYFATYGRWEGDENS